MSTPAHEMLTENDSSPQTAPLRFVTAASLFDGHDAAINVMRRLIQGAGTEVIHLGHNRSVSDVVQAALQEDADGIAISVATFMPPPDCPKIVTLSGSPPKPAIMSRTHASAMRMSRMPALVTSPCASPP